MQDFAGDSPTRRRDFLKSSLSYATLAGLSQTWIRSAAAENSAIPTVVPAVPRATSDNPLAITESEAAPEIEPRTEPVAEADDDLVIVDTHQHLWDLGRFRLPWITEEETVLNRNFLPEDYAKAVAGARVVQAVYMEVDLAPEQQHQEADYVLDLIRRKVGFTTAAVISGRPESEAFPEYIRRYKDQPLIKGVRRVLHSPQTPPGYVLAKTFLANLRLLGEMGKLYDFCMRPDDLSDVVKAVDACPETTFILDHCGNPKWPDGDLTAWKRSIDAIARRPKVYCKVSGIVASAKGRKWGPDDLAPVVNHVLASFGPDRVLFGGDWPVCNLGASYQEWLKALKTIVHERPVAERRKLFSENAVQLYGLPKLPA